MIDPHTIRQCLLDRLQARGPEKSICPSEVARELGGPEWRSLMDSVRQVGIALADAGIIQVTQKGQVVDPRQTRGPIRYRYNLSGKKPFI